MAERGITLAAVLALAGAAVGASTGAPSAERPPAGFTGGFGEPTCVTCHLGNDVNAFGGRVFLAGLPTAYEPGSEYVLTVVLEAEETEVAGFQLTSRFTGGAGWGENAGDLLAADGRVSVSDSAGVAYAHHSSEGTRTPSPDGSSWSVVWQAPREGGPVAINVAANSGNGDNSPLSDLVYLAESVVPPAR